MVTFLSQTSLTQGTSWTHLPSLTLLSESGKAPEASQGHGGRDQEPVARCDVTVVLRAQTLTTWVQRARAGCGQRKRECHSQYARRSHTARSPAVEKVLNVWGPAMAAACVVCKRTELPRSFPAVAFRKNTVTSFKNPTLSWVVPGKQSFIKDPSQIWLLQPSTPNPLPQFQCADPSRALIGPQVQCTSRVTPQQPPLGLGCFLPKNACQQGPLQYHLL